MNPRRVVTILQINDAHGYLEPHPEHFWTGAKAEYRTVGGFARLLTIFKRVRQERDGAVFAFDNGDTYHGTSLAVASRGQALIEAVNHLGLDASTVHWDVAYGTDRMRELAAKLDHPLLACNCYVKATGERAYGAPIPPGPVTVNDLWNIVPPNPPVSTVELTGQEMWDMLEDNLDHTFAADPYQQMGGYVKRCLGLTLYVSIHENSRGSGKNTDATAATWNCAPSTPSNATVPHIPA